MPPPPRRVLPELDEADPADLDARIELNRLPPFVKYAKTDAQVRLYTEDELIAQCRQDFRHLDMDPEKLRSVAQHVIKSLRIEFDVNIERFNNEDQPLLDAEKFRVRFQMLGFKFQRFLDSIKQFEDEEFARERQKEKEFATAESTANRLQSGAFSDLGTGKVELPADLVQNMFKVGVEAHLRMVKRLMFGDKYFGLMLTYRNLNVVHKAKGQMHAGPVLRALDPRGRDSPHGVWVLCGHRKEHRRE